MFIFVNLIIGLWRIESSKIKRKPGYDYWYRSDWLQSRFKSYDIFFQTIIENIIPKYVLIEQRVHKQYNVDKLMEEIYNQIQLLSTAWGKQ